MVFKMAFISFQVFLLGEAMGMSALCLVDPQLDINLKSSGEILQDIPVYSQDGAGICSAATASITMDAFIRRTGAQGLKSPPVSIWGLAILGAQAREGSDARVNGQRAYAQYENQSYATQEEAQIAAENFQIIPELPEARPKTYQKDGLYYVAIPRLKFVDPLYGLHTCEIVEEVKQLGTYCPRDDSPLEQSLLNSGISGQAEILNSLGKIYDHLYSNQGEDPEAFWKNIEFISDQLWSQAGEFCQLSLEQRVSLLEQAKEGSAYASFMDFSNALLSNAFYRFNLAREPLEDLFKKEMELEKLKEEIKSGPNPFYPELSWEDEIKRTEVLRDESKTEEAREIYQKRIDASIERLGEITARGHYLEQYIADKKTSLDEELKSYYQARSEVAAFLELSNKSDMQAEDLDFFNLNGFEGTLQIDGQKLTARIKELGENKSKPLNARDVFPFPHLAKDPGFSAWEKSFEQVFGLINRDDCQEISHYLMLRGENPLASDSLGLTQCIDPRLQAPFNDLFKSLGQVGGKEADDAFFSLLIGMREMTPGESLSVTSFFEKLLVPNCLGHEQSFEVAPTCDYNFLHINDPDNVKDVLTMTNYISKGIPLAISICSNFLSEDKITRSGGECMEKDNHAVAITGYRCNSQGEIEFLVQNSWGEDWCPQNPKLTCLEGKGAFYIKESDLIENTLYYSAVASKDERKRVEAETRAILRGKKGK